MIGLLLLLAVDATIWALVYRRLPKPTRGAWYVVERNTNIITANVAVVGTNVLLLLLGKVLV